MVKYTTETIYNGSEDCPNCGKMMTPLEAEFSMTGLCYICQNEYSKENMKDRL